MTKFKKAYGEIENVSDRKYFTNSMHVPVWKQMSPFNKIDIESELTGYSSGGCITYVEVDENAARNETVVEQIIDYEMKEKDIRLVPIIDAGVKIEEGYDVYEEGVKNNYFCTQLPVARQLR